MTRRGATIWLRCLVATAAAVALAACSNQNDGGPTGELGLQLMVGDAQFDEASWSVACEGESFDGTIDLRGVPDAPVVVQIGGLPPGECTLNVSATSADGGATCEGEASFPVQAGEVTNTGLELKCPGQPQTGGVRVDGTVNFCPVLGALTAIPARVQVGFPIQVDGDAQDQEGDPIIAEWTATAGEFDDPSSQATNYTCTEPGDQTLTLNVHDGDPECSDSASVIVECLPVDEEPIIDAEVPDVVKPPVDAEPPPVDADEPDVVEPIVDAEVPDVKKPKVDAEVPPDDAEVPPDDAEVPPGETPDAVTVSDTLTCPTTIGLDVMVEGTVTVTPQAPFFGGQPTDVVIQVTATQMPLPVALDALVPEGRWSLDVLGATPGIISHTEIFDPPLTINVGATNTVDAGTINATLTPEAGATQVVLSLASVGIDAALEGAAVLPVDCPVPPGTPEIVFPVN